MKLAVIIVNYNVRHFLEQALLSVRKAAQSITGEIWVVDNNSVDDSVAMVREKFPEVHLIENTQNLGFSAANNQAIRASDSEYLLLLNPDTLIEEDTLEKCIRFMDSHPDAGGLGVRMIDGSGKFLPESKRGFPSPWTAFCKTFGLSRIFPHSSTFNHYHLGYLDEHATHQVEVLAGAFMMIRRSVLDNIGLLDETFFMYGEDIDLSYRILQAGYHNYYFPDTTIIHYKGESTKKGSLNYVRVFYQAMIIFARKHFTGNKATLFVYMLQAAIWFRALVTLSGNAFRAYYLPITDAALLYTGLIALKTFWASYYHQDPNYYDHTFLSVNAPIYTALWLAGIYFSGAYDEKYDLRRLARGILLGSLLIAALYGFLDMSYRSSRALILLGTAWTISATFTLRLLLHIIRFRNLNVGRTPNRNLVIAGNIAEADRVASLLRQAYAPVNIIGIVSPQHPAGDPSNRCLGNLEKLHDIVLIYRIDEIIFCASDIPSQDIMYWMNRLGPGLNYKIVPQDSMSIIGSSSKDSPGELYTIDIRFNISQSLHRRNKQFLDIILALLLLITLPIHLLLIPGRRTLIANNFQVLTGKKSWVGYAGVPTANNTLPKLRQGILTPLDALPFTPTDEATIQRLNVLYAKDYHVDTDLSIIWRAYRKLGSHTKNLIL